MPANMMLMLNIVICSSLVGRNIEYHNNDSVDIGRDDSDDIYIMMQCLSVCNEKSSLS